MAVSLLLLPARAHALLAKRRTGSCNALAQVAGGSHSRTNRAVGRPGHPCAHDEVRLALTALENISDEAARERRNYLSDDSDPNR